MASIQLLAIDNRISRQKQQLSQMLFFWLLVENRSYNKQVAVSWAGDDHVWIDLEAHYHSPCGEQQEYWLASLTHILPRDNRHHGDIEAACWVSAQGYRDWDNNRGQNYQSTANSGLQLLGGLPLLNLHFASHLTENSRFYPISVAISPSIKAERVWIEWTIDNWKTVHTTPCHPPQRRYNSALVSSAQSIKPQVTELWKARLKIEQAYHLQYCLVCEAEGKVYWDNNSGHNYQAQHRPLSVMILNLHCYQEENQDHKFSQIARAIDESGVDIICLQEVAEHWNNGHGDWPSNAANIINQRLPKPFHLHTDWSHLGFERYREGVAILCRYPLREQDARYVSDSQDPYSIHARKVVSAEIRVPGIGLIKVFSAHLSWWEDGFASQFQRLSAWAAEKPNSELKATLLCGDFNISAGSVGYNLVVSNGEYQDQFLAANNRALFTKIFQVKDPHWQEALTDDYRIDYIFMHKTSQLKVINASVLFTEQDYGQVSDHCGYLLSFEPK